MIKQEFSKILKSRYIHTSWFQTATQKDLNELIVEPLFKLEIEFNAYGLIEPAEYLGMHKEKVIKILAAFKQNVEDFKFKFVGWEKIHFNLEDFLEPINKNIRANVISLNLSKFRGSQNLFLQTIKTFFQKRCKSLTLNFANWRMKYNTIKELHSGGYVITNDLEKLQLDLSGWGKDIDYFFDLHKSDNDYQVRKKMLVNEFKEKLGDFFVREILTSIQQEVLLDLRNWHKDFKLEETKKQLYNQVKQGVQIASMLSYSKNENAKPIFKLNFII